MRPWQQALQDNPPILDYGETFDPIEGVGAAGGRVPLPSAPPPPAIPIGARPVYGAAAARTAPAVRPPVGRNPVMAAQRPVFGQNPGMFPRVQNPYPPQLAQLIGLKVLEKLLGLRLGTQYSDVNDFRRNVGGGL